MNYLIGYIICSYLLYIVLGRIYIRIKKDEYDIVTMLFWLAPITIIALTVSLIASVNFDWLGKILCWIGDRLYKIASILLGS